MLRLALLSLAAVRAASSPCDLFATVPIPASQQRALSPWTDGLSSSGQPLLPGAYPFCFGYGGRASSEILPSWNFVASPPALLPDGTGRTLYTFTWTEPSSSACNVVEANVTLFAGQPGAVDAVIGLRNEGSSPSAIVTWPASLSAAWASVAADPVRLYSRIGGDGGATDFYPAAVPVPELQAGAKPTVLQNQCGTGSFGTLPFFQIEWPKQRRGLLFSLGWSGQWLATVSRNTTGAVSVTAGLGGQKCGGAPGSLTRGENDEYPAFQVAPGERLRLLRVMIIGYNSSTDAALHQTGLNLHRRIILDAIAPRAAATPGRWPWSTTAHAPASARFSSEETVSGNGGPIYPLVAAISNKGDAAWESANETENMALLQAIQSVPGGGEEEIWVDIGWNTGGAFGGNYAEPIQDSVDSHWWPNRSLAPVFHAAHAAGVQTILWFMPEMNVNSSCDLASWGKPAYPQSQLCAGSSANQPSYLAAHHPEWLAWEGGQSGPMKTSLVDLGIGSAREYVVEYLSQAIEGWEVDTFRYDLPLAS